MPPTFQILRSSTAGHVPPITAGVIAVNYADKIMYISDGSTTIPFATSVLLASQTQGKVWASPSGITGGASFRVLVPSDLGSGTPGSGNYLRGDGAWTALPISGPAGSDTYVQYNSAGTMGAESTFVYNYTTNTLTVSNLAGSGTAITALNASNLGSGTVPLAQLGSSGTPSSSTFLRGDNTWGTPAGTFVPSGSNGDIQWYFSGAFASNPALNWSPTGKLLSITGNTSTSSLDGAVLQLNDAWNTSTATTLVPLLNILVTSTGLPSNSTRLIRAAVDGSEKFGVDSTGSITTPIPMVPTAPGRLTLSSTLANSDADISGAGTLYYLPYIGDKILLYNNSTALYELCSLPAGLSMSGWTSGFNYDIYVVNGGNGTSTLDKVIWTNDITRATTPTQQDGMFFKGSGSSLLSRYVGTVRMSGSGTSSDTAAMRLVWNLYNQVPRRLLMYAPGGSYGAGPTSTIGRYYNWLNGSNAYVIYFVCGGMQGSAGFLHLTYWLTCSVSPTGSNVVYNSILFNGNLGVTPTGCTAGTPQAFMASTPGSMTNTWDGYAPRIGLNWANQIQDFQVQSAVSSTGTWWGSTASGMEGYVLG